MKNEIISNLRLLLAIFLAFGNLFYVSYNIENSSTFWDYFWTAVIFLFIQICAILIFGLDHWLDDTFNGSDLDY